ASVAALVRSYCVIYKDTAFCDIILHVLMLIFFNDTASTEIYTLSLHDALPISSRSRSPIRRRSRRSDRPAASAPARHRPAPTRADRKSTRLNSSHVKISYAVFCLKKKTHLERQVQLKQNHEQKATWLAEQTTRG